MKLYYYATAHGNFGDDLNLWLWDEILPNWREWRPEATLFGVGTVLNDAALSQHPTPVVMGSGVGYGARPTRSTLANCEFRAVRGPLSADALGLSSNTPMLDPAMLIPDLKGMGGLKLQSRAIFIPHYSTANLDIGWEALCDDVGIDYVSPQQDSKAVILRIANAPLVLTESMHGAILADAYRVPWVPLEINDSFNKFKWNDWAKSLDIEIDFLDVLSEVRPIANVVKTAISWLNSRQNVSSGGKNTEPHEVKKVDALPERRRLQSAIERMAPLFRSVVKRKLKIARRKQAFISENQILLRRRREFSDACLRLVQDYSR